MKTRVYTFFASLILLVGMMAFTAPEATDLRMNLKVGDRVYLEQESKQTVTQEIMGMTQEVLQNFTIGYTMEVTEITAEGNYDIKVTYSRVAAEMNMMGQSAEYDSESGEPTTNPMVAPFAGLVNQSFHMIATPKGIVEEINGAGAVIDNMLQSMGVTEPTQQAFFKKTLNAQFGDEALASNMGQLIGYYPENPVSPGDTWANDVVIKSVYPINLTVTYTYEGLTGEGHRILVDAIVKAEDAEMSTNGMEMILNLEGTQKGYVTLDKSTMWTNGSELEMDLSGNVEGVSGQINGMSWPMAIQTTITTVAK